ncbi:MAG: AraC family transcriptional regulator [Spirosomataceae bacterium]
MQTNGIEFRTTKPTDALNDFVESFWMFENHTDKNHQIVILPDGRFDIIFSFNDKEVFEPTLKGLDIEPEQTTIPVKTFYCAVSFKLLAIEYILDQPVQTLLNTGMNLPINFWGIERTDLENFDLFCNKVSEKLISLIKPNIDERKQRLFSLIYETQGTVTVKELSENVFWSSRQINRYFTQTFGISLKAYCNIIRFKSSLQHIKKGKLFPELNFTDQTHFIKEVKKMSGVTPKELSKNKNDRFILLSAIS